MKGGRGKGAKGGRVIIAVLAIAVLAGGYAATTAPPGPRTMREFDPHRLADLESRMWQAYYAKQNVRLFGLLVTMLHEQYHYSWATAAREGFHLARAAAVFGNARSDYDRVLPDLTNGYATARDWLHASFDPPAVARAELAWWVARRVKGQDGPEHVGALMADEYAMLYAVPRDAVLEAATLRARAGKLRDTEAAAPDWPTVTRLLDLSYVSLHQAVRQ